MNIKNTFKPFVETLDVAIGVCVEEERLVGLLQKISCVEKACRAFLVLMNMRR